MGPTKKLRPGRKARPDGPRVIQFWHKVKWIHVRLSAEDYADLETVSKDMNLTKSKAIRSLIWMAAHPNGSEPTPGMERLIRAKGLVR